MHVKFWSLVLLSLLTVGCASHQPNSDQSDSPINSVIENHWRVDYGEIVRVQPVLVPRDQWNENQYCRSVYTERLGSELKCKRVTPYLVLDYSNQFDQSLVKRYELTYRFVDQYFVSITTFYTDDTIELYIDESGNVVGPTHE